MKIDVHGRPTAGLLFRAVIRGGIGITRTVAAIDGVEIFASDCPDPPCHEMFAVPRDAAGATLVIAAMDSSGNRAVESFVVAPFTTSGTPMPSPGGAASMGG